MSSYNVIKYKGIEFPSLAIVIIHVAHFTFWPVEAQTFNVFSKGGSPVPLPSPSLVRPLPSSSPFLILCYAPSMSGVHRVNSTDPRIATQATWHNIFGAALFCSSNCEFFLLFRGSLHAKWIRAPFLCCMI